MGTPRPETKFSLCLLDGGRPHRCYRFSKLEKASLKQFCFLIPDGLKLLGCRSVSLIFVSWAPTV